MNLLDNPRRIPEIYGTLIAIGLILFFLIMQFAGLVHIIELRLLNLFILMAGVYMALKKFRTSHENKLNYFRALITGVATSTIGASTFAVFLFIYLKLNNSMMQSLIDHEPMGPYLNAYIVAAIVTLEGVFSGIFVTFVLINYINTDEV